MFEAIRKVTNNMQSITAARVIEILVNQPELNGLIIELNTQDQLFKKGVDSKGLTLGVYAPFTIEIKKSKGQPTNHITLKDTGDVYKTWMVTTLNGDIIITANFIKDGEDIIEKNRLSEDVVGLIDENLQKIIDEIAIKTPNLVESLLFA
jgi:hypothetical protein